MNLERFLRYVKIDTMSSEESTTCPSTSKQFDLAILLVKELKELGLSDAKVDEHAIVTATLPTNSDKQDDVIGFNAHMDTIPGFSGTNVKPRIIENYDGKDIELNPKMIMSVNSFPFLPSFKGKTLIVTDGTTVLGADDKAGVANIMNMLEYFYNHPEVKHATLKIAFTPDEEIGGDGIMLIDRNIFNPDFAYTVDGGTYNDINYECFNAASAKIHITGLDIHPGSAKDKMINAVDIATEFNQMLPAKEKPMYTDGYEGFNHLCSLAGEVGYADMEYIIRNHDLNKLQQQKQLFVDITNELNQKYGNVITLNLKDSYLNMAENIKKDMRSVNRAREAMERLGFVMQTTPIRGGTDGARLTETGLNTPNLGTGGYNCHGPYEFACVEEMEAVVNILVEIAKINE